MLALPRRGRLTRADGGQDGLGTRNFDSVDEATWFFELSRFPIQRMNTCGGPRKERFGWSKSKKNTNGGQRTVRDT